MIKIYGSDLCPDCREAKEELSRAGKKFDFFDICTDMALMREFLSIRDTSPVFGQAREIHSVGIPCLILENGTVTLNYKDA